MAALNDHEAGDVTNIEKEAGETNSRDSREKRFREQREKCQRIVHYLSHGKHVDGLTKNQQRVVRGQAKNYVMDETSK